MNTISLIGAFLISLAFLSYGVGSISLQRFKMVSIIVLLFLFIGILLDVAAAVCMIIGSSNRPFTIHGILGYSALIIMVIDLIWVWKVYRKNGIDAIITEPLHKYAKFAYGGG